MYQSNIIKLKLNIFQHKEYKIKLDIYLFNSIYLLFILIIFRQILHVPNDSFDTVDHKYI
jgi:hypothetical protein